MGIERGYYFYKWLIHELFLFFDIPAIFFPLQLGNLVPLWRNPCKENSSLSVVH